MSDHESHNQHIEDLILDIELTSTNVVYDVYAQGYGPLTIDQLDPEVRVTKKLADVIGIYGWPSALTDGGIEPVPLYEGTADFTDALWARGQPEYLNNLPTLLRSKPSDTYGGNSIEVYGLKPVLHRANAIAPDLFSATRAFFEKKSSATSKELADYLHTCPVAARQIEKAYYILGRLIKVDDNNRVAEIMHLPTEGRPMITSAHQHLTE